MTRPRLLLLTALFVLTLSGTIALSQFALPLSWAGDGLGACAQRWGEFIEIRKWQ
jgi:hypothetical protein